jgi:hypothetical protein
MMNQTDGWMGGGMSGWAGGGVWMWALLGVLVVIVVVIKSLSRK